MLGRVGLEPTTPALQEPDRSNRPPPQWLARTGFTGLRMGFGGRSTLHASGGCGLILWRDRAEATALGTCFNCNLRAPSMHPLFRKILEVHGAPRPIPADITTSFDNPPIPSRNCDWSAVAADYDPERGDPIGRGATEQAAIADLLREIECATEPALCYSAAPTPARAP